MFNSKYSSSGCICKHTALIIIYPCTVFFEFHSHCQKPLYPWSCEASCLCVSSDVTCGHAEAGIYQCHPHQWEALYRDMSAPCLLVVLMKLGVGRVGSLVQVPGFPSNESASPHSNWLLPWELRLGLPSIVLKYRLISTHTYQHAHTRT